MHVLPTHPLVDGAQLLRHATGTMIVRNNRDFNAMQPWSVRAIKGPIRHNGDRKRCDTPPGNRLINPIPHQTGTHRAIRDGAQRHLPDNTPVFRDQEQRARTVAFPPAQFAHPLVEGQPRAAKRIVGIPRGQPCLITPAQGLQLILIVKRARPQFNRRGIGRSGQGLRHHEFARRPAVHDVAE